MVKASRRIGVVFLLAGVSLLRADPASAVCTDVGLGRLVQEAQVVWWVSVTGTQLVDPGQYGDFPGRWTLTVRIREVLKGSGPAGSDQTVILGNCGLTAFINTKAALLTFVGRHQLFIGNITDGALFTFPVILAQRDLSPKEQHDKALHLLGAAPEASSPSEALPRPAHDLPADAAEWRPVAILAGIVVVISALTFWWRRRAVTG